MSSHARQTTTSPTPAAPWILVVALIAGAALLGGALVAGSVALLVIGVVLVLAAVVVVVAMTRRGTAPLSFTEEFPDHTYGPRATTEGDSSPPIDTQPNRPSGPPEYRTLEEVQAQDMSEPPDDTRVFPQYSNLGPDERLRNVGGHEVIERAEPRNDQGGEPEDTRRDG
ncbi:MAG: hypothetical protein HOW97_13880 [Catenulispora sp.]|nr:hypothetical protein [Catenulispora sp.]